MRMGLNFAREGRHRFIALFLAVAVLAACGDASNNVGGGVDDNGDDRADAPSAADSGSGATGTSKSDAATTGPGTRDASATRDTSAARDASTGGGNTVSSKDAGAAEVDGATAGSMTVVDAGGAGPADAGGATSCDWGDPPADVAMWINESWNAQLGSNIKSRKAWNLDNVMLNKGQLNLCVRWGATSAVPEMVSANLASTVERWFNDWFKSLGGYGCFPYGEGIKVKITGWAVRPGKESLLGQVDPAVPVYTGTDAEGEPKCPDDCSSFVHWDHKFPNCKGGDANHSDYWLWFDDKLPGNGGAAAVGGDWGLRMPVSTFVGAFANKSFGIVEHEMGHGFGFQDYYEWTGARPKGGSLMIVQSSQSQSPTSGDVWLLRRTWKEMKSLRGW